MATKNSSFSSMRRTNVLSGSETTGLKQRVSSPRISPGLDLAEHLVAVDARAAAGRPASTPQTSATWARCSGFARSRAARELVALLAVLAPALAVALAGDGRVAAALAADASRGEHDVDRAQAVLDAVGVVLDAARVQEEARLRGAPPLRGLADGPLGDAGHLARCGRGSTRSTLRATSSKPTVWSSMNS